MNLVAAYILLKKLLFVKLISIFNLDKDGSKFLSTLLTTKYLYCISFSIAYRALNKLNSNLLK